MVMLPFMMFVIVCVTVSAAFGLESCLDLLKIRSEAIEQIFDHVVGPNQKNVFSNFGRQVAIPQVPGKPHQLMAVRMPDLYERFGGGSDPEPGAVIELQPIAIPHGDGLGKVQEDIFSMVRRETNSPAMTRVKIERESADGLLLRPVSRGTMDGSALHKRPQYRK
jgi:hypothetical protein